MLKSTLVATVLALSLAAGAVTPSFAQESYKQELKEHPRLVKAIIDLEDAIAYMDAMSKAGQKTAAADRISDKEYMAACRANIFDSMPR